MLDDMVVLFVVFVCLFVCFLFLVFKRTSILFSIVAAPTYIPTNNIGGFVFLHTLSSIYYLYTF